MSTTDETRTGGTHPGDAAPVVVSVVVPAHNAGRWIGETLASVSAQTVRSIEIIVVDDGSTDDTAEIVAKAAAGDPRIRLIRQENGGVARARNAGLAAARGEFFAPIDADDLWHPTRLERHLEAFRAGPPELALVYSAYAGLDPEGRVYWPRRQVELDGWAFEVHLCDNAIGNGSSITVRTAAARAVGGYSPALRDRGAEGYEDWLFQLEIARRFQFAHVPLALIGYRQYSDNMSANAVRMARSGLEAMREIKRRCPERSPALFWWPRARATGPLLIALVRAGEWRAAGAELIGESGRNPLLPAYLPALAIQRLLWRVKALSPGERARRSPAGRPLFAAIDPAALPPLAPTLAMRLWVGLYRWIGTRRRMREAPDAPKRGEPLRLAASGNTVMSG